MRPRRFCSYGPQSKGAPLCAEVGLCIGRRKQSAAHRTGWAGSSCPCCRSPVSDSPRGETHLVFNSSGPIHSTWPGHFWEGSHALVPGRWPGRERAPGTGGAGKRVVHGPASFGGGKVSAKGSGRQAELGRAKGPSQRPFRFSLGSRVSAGGWDAGVDSAGPRKPQHRDCGGGGGSCAYASWSENFTYLGSLTISTLRRGRGGRG